jgi:YVTN family beta-propeller protein
MKRTIQSKECRVHSFIKVLGLIVLMLSTVVCIAYAAPFAYVTNSGSNTVSVIDTAINNVTATVHVEWNPRGVAVTPDGKRVYVTCKATNDSSSICNDIVSVIDTETNKVTSTVEVGLEPAGIAVTPDGKKVYVVNGAVGTISVVDTATNRVTSTIDIGNGNGWGEGKGIAVAPDGKKVYVVTDRGVSVIDTETNKVTSTVEVGLEPAGIAVTPDGKKIYVTICGIDNVAVIDTATNKVTATMPVESPGGVAVTPDGSKVYVANFYNNSVSVIDTTTTNVSAMVNLGAYGLTLSRGIVVTPDGKKVYVANYGSDSVPGNTISIIDTATNKITDTVKVGSNPSAVAIENLMGTVNNSSNQSTSNETSTQNAPYVTPGGFNYLILAMIVLYIWKKST